MTFILPLIGAIVSAILGVWWYSHAKSHGRKHTHKTDTEETDFEVEMSGVYITPFHNIVLRAWFSGLVGSLLTLGLILAGHWLEVSLMESWLVSIGVWLSIVTLLAWRNQLGVGEAEKQLEIPNSMLAILTWLNFRFGWFLTEGDHPWLPVWLGFRINRTPLPQNKNLIKSQAGPEQGLVPDGNLTITLKVWDSSGAAEGSPGRNRLKALTQGNSQIEAEFLIKFCVRDPARYANTLDPVLAISEQARSGFRKTIALFRDSDIGALKSVLSPLTEGKIVLVAFVTKNVSDIPKGSVVRNLSGLPITRAFEYPKKWDELGQKARQNAINKALTEFKEELAKLDFIATLYGDSYKVQALDIAEKLLPVIRNVGAELISTTISNLILSDEVLRAAQLAEAAHSERVRTLILADANAQAAKTLTEAVADADELARVMPLISSGKGHVVHVSGAADSLTRAAAIVGGGSKGGK